MSRKKVDRIETELHVVDINAKGLGVAKNKEGAVYFIKDVIPGDIFLDGSVVTAIFKVANTDNKMYKIDDIS